MRRPLQPLLLVDVAMKATTPASSLPSAQPADDRIDRRKLLTFLILVFGMFMAILDIQIVSASLSEIQAGISASADEISWVQTSYLVAEVVMIPLTGFLARALSTRVMFTISAAGFTLMSLLCGLAENIEQMIVFRALQGFIGGAMIPTVFAAGFILFGKKRAFVMPVVGLIATLAPTIGPTVGGYLTEIASWHWLFFINLIPGPLVAIGAWTLIDFDKAEPELLKTFDWPSLGALALFLASLEYVLEEGASKGWFDDGGITTFALLAALGGLFFFWRTATIQHPIVDLTAFRNRSFAAGSFLSVILGVLLFGMTYLYPVFLGRVRGYSALMIGETMFVTGLAMMFTAVVLARQAQKMDPRLVLFAGLTCLAMSTYEVSFITRDWDFGELLFPQVLRGVGLMICMIPINNVALGGLPQAQLKGAAGLFNLCRNLGGALGLAVINTLINHRTDLHLLRLHEVVNPANPRAAETLAALAQRYSTMPDSQNAALKTMASLVRSHASVMAFADVFLVLCAMCVCAMPLVFLLSRPEASGGGAH